MLPPTFHPGDQKQYGGFDNRGLEPGHRYVLFVLAVLQKSEPVSAPRVCPRPTILPPSSQHPVVRAAQRERLEVGWGAGIPRRKALLRKGLWN